MAGQSREALAAERVAALPIWSGAVAPARLAGGITNMNFTVEDAGSRYVVRVGDDIPVHQILRFNEAAASRAAHAAGISPEVVHSETGIIVIRYVDGITLAAPDVRDPARLARIVPLLRRVHRDMPRHLRGPLLAFWVFHVIRDYAHTLTERGSRHAPDLPALLEIAGELEAEVGPVELVFGHNDLLPANFIDDGNRVWLIDWDYAGWNSPLFDLANLASNAEFDRAAEERLLAAYFGRAPDASLWKSYTAMKCASLLRETMWGMVSEITSHLAFDYAAYAADYLARFQRANAARKERA
ncbi:MAG: choline/ethanolamine kinase family protein [Bauldia sp.]